MRRLVWANVSVWSMIVSVFLLPAPGFASVFYDYKKIAATGEGNITAIQLGVSVNARGRVAFQATKDGVDNIFIGEGALPPVNIVKISQNASVGTVFTGGVQVNDNNQIISRERTSTSLGPESRLKIWNSNLTPAASSTLMTCGPSSDCLTVLPNPSLSNNSSPNSLPNWAANIGIGDNIFVCREPTCLIGQAGPFDAGQFKAPLIATSGDYVIRNGSTATSPIRVFKAGSVFDIASSAMGWTALGEKPGISDDGSVVAFAGNKGPGAGVFASIQWGSNYSERTTVRVAGEGLTTGFPDLGADLSGDARYFSEISVNERIGVIRHVAQVSDPTGLRETIVVAFLAKPNKKSPTQSYISGLVFSDQQALWSRRIDVMEWDSSKPLLFNEVALTTTLKLVYHYPIPVAQVGEKVQVGSEEILISGLAVHDPISSDGIGRNDSSGNPLPQKPGDHFVTFVAQSGTKQVVLRADHQSACILFVQRLAQGPDGSVDAEDPVDWSGNILDTHPESKTISLRGCSLTGVAMQLNYAAMYSGVSLSATPGGFNDLMKLGGAFTPTADIIWKKSVDYYRDHELVPFAPTNLKVKGIEFSMEILHNTDPDGNTYLKRQLCEEGLPIHIRVEGTGSVQYGHSVLVTGTVNDRFIIVDPAHRDRLSLAASPYNGTYETRGVVKDPPDTSSVTFSIGENADIQITDMLGNVTDASQKNIPKSVYFVDIYTDEGEAIPSYSPPRRFVSVDRPLDGLYNILIKGLKNGPFTLDVYITDRDGKLQKPLTFDGTITSGAIQTVQLNVQASPEGNSQLIPPVVLQGDLDGDSDIDKNDIAVILAAKGTAASGPNDPRDVDKDGQITILDARKLATMCTRLNCATQ